MKKRNLLLSLLLAGSLVTPVFATDNGTGTGTSIPSWSEGGNPEAYFTKTLEYPAGVELPPKYKSDYEFSFNLLTFNDEKVTSGEFSPYISSFTEKVSFSTSEFTLKDGVYSATVRSNNILENLNELNRAGKYIYDVKEIVPESETGTGGNSNGMNYSNAEYNFCIIVKNGENGTYISSAYAKEVADDDGKEVSSADPNEGKINPSEPGTGDSGEIVPSDFNFTNTYKEIMNPSTDDSTLTIQKLVTSSNAQDKGIDVGTILDNGKKFTFTIVLTGTELAELDENITYQVNSENAQIVTVFGNTATISDVELGNNDTVSFSGLPTGTKVTVTEKGTKNYTATYRYGEITGTGKEGSDFTTADLYLTSKGSNNKIVFTNDFDANSVSPTGIIINNLPYILLVVVGVAGIALYEAGRRRFNN